MKLHTDKKVTLICFFIFLCISSVIKGQDIEIRTRIMDKSTNSPIPWVNVYANGKLKCISNIEGDILTEVHISDTLLFMVAGYAELRLFASRIPASIAMEPLPRNLHEVIVLSDIAVLMNTFRKMKKEYRLYKNETCPYFNRITMKSGEQMELVEDFLHAKSAISLRDLELYTGQYWGKTVQGDSISANLRKIDLHKILSVGPMMPNNRYNNNYKLPFPLNCSPSHLKRFYEISSDILDMEGKLVYCIHLKKKDENQMMLLTGDMFIDLESFHLLKFDGNMDLPMFVKRQQKDIVIHERISGSLKIHVNYRENKGFTEVSDMYYEFIASGLSIVSVLFNVEDYQYSFKTPIPIRENILDAINKSHTSTRNLKDPNVVKRTKEEEAVIRHSTMKNNISNPEFPSITEYIQKAMNFNKVVPQEKVYLHFDNMGYFENETMWFKAYVTRTDNRRASDLSKVLYVELLNPSGDVLKTQKYPIDSLGQSHGDMKLDTLFGAGFYEVRAYTRYMTNWGVNAVFSRVFPIFKAPKEEGKYDDLTIREMLYKHRDPNNRDRTDSLYLKAMDEGIYTSDLMKTISVQFYPEGGNLIKGKKGRVAMLAVDDNGRPYQGEGFVMNSKGEVLASVKTDSLGRGLFEVIPDSGTMVLQMKNLKDKVQEFPLPQIQLEGCALSLDAVSEDISATLQCTDSLCGHLLGYVLMHNGNISYCDTVTASPLIEIALDRQKQEEGVSQLTVFDSDGRIWAERLFFICPKQNDADSIRVVAKTERLKPCGKVELELQAQPNAYLSFSAMDAETMTNGKQGNMKTWMLLSSEVKGYIHNIDCYFESDDKEHRESTDLLMMTQGWRRYDWNLMSGRTTFEKSQPIEDQFYVFGKLNVYRKHNPVNDVNLQAFLYNQQGQSLSGTTTTDKDGNYAFAMPFVDGEWKMQIFTRKKMKDGEEKRRTYYVGIDRQFSPTARYITPLETEIQHPLKANFFQKDRLQELSEEDEFIPITKKDHVLQNVTVKAKRRYFTNDDWKYKNEAWGRQYATLHYDIDKELDDILDKGEPEPTIFEFLCKKNALFNNPECKDLPIPIVDTLDINKTGHEWYWHGRLSYTHRPIKWIVDNGDTPVKMEYTPDWTRTIRGILGAIPSKTEETEGDMFGAITSDAGATGDNLFPFNMSEIKSLYIVPHSLKETDGAVRVYLYTHKKFTTESQKGLRRTYFQGFNIPSTFQMEDYNVIPPMADFRRTIYWNPDIRTDKDGKAKVEFFNNSTCQEMYISTEGMTEDGRILVHE